jgi:serine/threonine protein kinase
MSADTPTSAHELSPGDVCDGYRILSLIAAGGMGDVYEAVHDPSGRTVAVKCLKVRHRNKEDARARMKMEAVVLSELQHENLVQVYDAGVTDAGTVWFAMERLQGQTLRDILFLAGRLPIPDALHYASEIADGVDAVHEVNVIHRDLKPENVFVTTENVVKVLDLGTGKFTGYGLNSTDRMRVLGTTAYMSPEQIKGLRVDPRADVYALGLILYEMIAGRHALVPEGGHALPQGVEEMALMQLQAMPKPLSYVAPSCPLYVAAIVTKAIAKDRAQRFSSMALLSRELRAARKRFVAENQFEGAGAPSSGEGLRQKFGAPPRPALARDTDADAQRIGVNDFPTEVQTRLDFTLDDATAVPGRVPTLLLSSSSVPSMPAAIGVRSDLTDRGLPPDEVRNRTTQTNPIGFVRVAEISGDDSIEIDFGPKPWLAFWRYPFFRRAVATLGLGALIGVPPAILGVIWARHYRAPTASIDSLSQTTPPPPVRSLPSAAGALVSGAEPPVAALPSAAKPLSSAASQIATAHPARTSTAGVAPPRGPRARPKAAPANTASLAAEDAVDRSPSRRPAAPAVDHDTSPSTILPPSGL